MIELSPLQRRALALGLFALTLFFTIIFVAVPAIAWTLGYAPERQAAEARYLRYVEAAADLETLRLQMEVAERDVGLDIYLLEPTTPERGAAWLQGELRRMAQTVGAQVASSRSNPPGMSHGFQQVSTQVQVRGSINQLRDLLLAIETAEPVLQVQEMTIRSQNVNARQASRALSNVTVTLTVAVFMRSSSTRGPNVRGPGE